MGSYLTKIVGSSTSAGDGGMEHDNTVVTWVASVTGGEGRVSKKASAGSCGESLYNGDQKLFYEYFVWYIPNSVDVQCVDATLTKGSLHGGLEAAIRTNLVEPVCIGGVINASNGERKTSTSIRLVHHIDLCIELRVARETDRCRDSASISKV